MPRFTMIRMADGWEGEVHPADAAVLVASGAAVDLDAEAEAPVAKPKPRAKPKAKPVEIPPANDLPLDADSEA